MITLAEKLVVLVRLALTLTLAGLLIYVRVVVHCLPAGEAPHTTERTVNECRRAR